MEAPTTDFSCPACGAALPAPGAPCPACAAAIALEPGSIFAERYRVLGPLGAGGCGVVYKVEHLLLHEVFALKLQRGGARANDVARERFTREARAICRFSHANAVTVRDFGVSGDALYMVMDYAPGKPLEALLAEGPLGAGRAAMIVRQVL